MKEIIKAYAPQKYKEINKQIDQEIQNMLNDSGYDSRIPIKCNNGNEITLRCIGNNGDALIGIWLEGVETGKYTP